MNLTAGTLHGAAVRRQTPVQNDRNAVPVRSPELSLFDGGAKAKENCLVRKTPRRSGRFFVVTIQGDAGDCQAQL
jgi:hypothetical protein